jgi:hypothetical protein
LSFGLPRFLDYLASLQIIIGFLFFVTWREAIIKLVIVGRYGSILNRIALAGGIFIETSWIHIREWAMDNLD